MRRLHALLFAVVLVAGLAPSARSAPLDAKRREASRLQGEIAKQGRRLSIANEDFLDAQLRRESLDVKVARARKDLRAAEEQWQVLKQRLGKRVRVLYKHPGAWFDSILGASSFGELARRQFLTGSVLTLDTDLLFETDRARAEITARQASLESVRAEARSEEKELDAKRATVDKELRVQRALLSRVQGEIASILEAERQRQLQAAARRAASGKASFGVPAPKNVGPVRPAAAKAITGAAAQLGKPYRWGAAGTEAFDCSGLTMYAWASAGVSIPHGSRAQYGSLQRVPNNEIQPGDLLFFGSPIHHVGIYEGGGVMINAPETGETVRRDSIYRRDFVGATRP